MQITVKIKYHHTIIFIGDSITDCGRRTNGWSQGNGYVKLFYDMLTIRDTEKQLNIINKEISENAVTDLQACWTDDVIIHKPEWLTINIGNDLLKTTRQNQDHVPTELFRNVYNDILSNAKSKLPETDILFIEPIYISVEINKQSFRKSVLDLLQEYIGIVREISKIYKTRLVRTHEIFQKLLKHHDADIFCPEPVHP